MSEAVVGILLAAGQSTRFGSNKLLHRLEDGTPVVLASARHLHSVLPRTLVVVADSDNEIARLMSDEGVEIVTNPHAACGMGSSIGCGVEASPDAKGWLVALADMPYVPEPVIAELAARLARGADLVAPVYRQRRGHPVGFSARHAAALRRLDKDAGARGVLLENADSLELVEVDSEGVLVDLDTPGSRPL